MKFKELSRNVQEQSGAFPGTIWTCCMKCSRHIPEISGKCQDEFQDNSDVQSKLLSVMINPGDPQVTVVGDDDQCIYQFRGAEPGNVLRLDPSFVSLTLVDNYRSTANILQVSAIFLEDCTSRQPKQLEPTRDDLKAFLREEVGTWTGMRHGLAVDTAKGLAYLHHDLAEPLIHRDVKPDNILVDESILAKVADFGEARHFDTKEAAARRKEASSQPDVWDEDEGNGDALTMFVLCPTLSIRMIYY